MYQQHRESSAHTYSRNLPIAIEKRSGNCVRDLDGNVFIDLSLLAKKSFGDAQFSTLTPSPRKNIQVHICEPPEVDALWSPAANPVAPSACLTESYSPSRGAVGKYELHVVVDDFFHEMTLVQTSSRVLCYR
jgi:hypothetical protein